MKRSTCAFLAVTSVFALSSGGPAFAGAGEPGHMHGHGATSTDGGPGKASEASRVVRIEARDTAFNVRQIQVRPGETVKFLIVNKGEIPHEFAIASRKEHEEHRAMMQQMPDMIHNDPNVVMLQPGETKEIVWKFGRDTDIEFACDMPGHYEQGMKGVFRLM